MKPIVPSFLLALALFASGWMQPARAAHAEALPVSGTASMFLAIFPELKTLRAPAAMQEGMIFTYANSDASTGGVSGSGVVEFSVTALDAATAVMGVSLYTYDGTAFSPAGGTATFDPPGVTEAWIHPSVLAKAEQVANDSLSVVRLEDSDNAGNKHKVVRFTLKGNQAETVWEFDEQSGIKIFGKFVGPSGQSQSRLHSVRMAAPPWPSGCRPTWAEVGKSFSYEGSTRLVQPSVGTDLTLPWRVTTAILQNGGRWSALVQESFMNGVSNGKGLTADGIGALVGAVWLPVSALGFNPAQALIDNDPVTGAELTWQRDADNNIHLTSHGATWDTILVYNGNTGLLSAAQTTVPVPYGYRITGVQFTGSQPAGATQYKAVQAAGCDVPALNRFVYLPTLQR